MAVVATSLLVCGPLFGEVILDGSFGASGPLAGPAHLIPAELGRQVGGNLFHSFGRFNLSSAESATFQGPDSVQNILARVTGGTASSIDGLLRSEIPGANLYLINPAGVMFGPNAKLDVSGSFVATTADYVKLGDTGKFSASNPLDDVLTSAPISAFGFLRPTPAPISINGSTLSVRSGHSVVMVGGDVDVNAGTLLAPENATANDAPGNVALAGVAAPGELSFGGLGATAIFPGTSLPALANVGVRGGSRIEASGRSGGRVVIRGGAFTVEDSDISSLTLGGEAGAGVEINVTGDFTIGNSGISSGTVGTGGAGPVTIAAGALKVEATGQINANSLGAGSAGAVKVHAETLTIDGGDGDAFTGLDAESLPGASGAAGRVEIVAAQFEMRGGGAISVVSSGESAAGTVEVNAKAIALSGGDVATVISADNFDRGQAGEIRMNAPSIALHGLTIVSADSYSDLTTGGAGLISLSGGTIELKDSARVSVTTFGSSHGGRIDVVADEFYAASGASDVLTGLFADAVSSSAATGGGGEINVKTDLFTLEPGGVLSASTAGGAASGSLRLAAKDTLITGSDELFTGLATATFSDTLTGQGGDIHVNSPILTIVDGGQIMASTSGPGRGGNITIASDDLFLSQGDRNRSTGIEAASLAEGAGGDAGRIEIATRLLTVVAGGGIVSSTRGPGRGGDIQINAGDSFISRNGSDISTGIFANTLSQTEPGRGGNIIIDSRLLTVSDRASVTASTRGIGAGGNMEIRSDSLLVSGAFVGAQSESEELAGPGGDLRVFSRRIFIEDDGQISTASFGPGKGGNLTATGKVLQIIGGNTDRLGGINASSYSPDAGGSGGNIRLDFDRIDLQASGQIAAATFGLGEAGDIYLDARELKVSGRLSQIVSQSQAELGGPSGDLFIRAGNLTVENGGALSAATFGSGLGGNIELTAQDVLLNGGARNIATGITVEASGSGEGGSIFLKTDRLRIYNDAKILSSTSGPAAGGSLTLEANSLLIDGGNTAETTGLFATSDTATSGSAGTIGVRSADITLIRGGSIAASTYGSGAGGDVRVDVEHLTITGDDTRRVTGIGADSRAGRFGGPGGNVFVHADEMLLKHRGTISAVTLGDGTGGDVQVNAKSLRIDGDSADGLTGINASSSIAGSLGAGGTIRLRADTLSLTDGGQVSALTAGLGRGGDVYVTAEELRATGAGSGINAPSIGTGRSGNGGLIVIDAGRVELNGGASVEASTSGSGHGGDIILQSDNLAMEDGAVIAARAAGVGAAGSVRLDIGGAALIADDALITSSSRRSTAGSVVIESDSDIRIRGSEISVEALEGNAGSIALNASRLLFLDHADIIAAAGLNGGNISMDSGFLIFSDSLISANAAAGRGGNITLVADDFFQSGTTITATGAQAGTINIVTPELDLSTGLVELPSSLFDASTQFREQCARRLGSDFSSFLVLGRGGIADSPDEPQVVISRKRRAERADAAR